MGSLNATLLKIDEVSSLVGVKPYVLRFWENQFKQISPLKSANGQTLYSERDVEVIQIIKKLLFEKKLNVEQAKKVLAQAARKETRPVVQAKENASFAQMAKDKLQEIISQTELLKKTHHWD